MMGPVRVQKGKANKYGREAGMVDVTRMPLHNPYFLEGSPELKVQLYRDFITKGDSEAAAAARQALPRLRGKNLACKCPIDQPCHADVLLELANATPAILQPGGPDREGGAT